MYFNGEVDFLKTKFSYNEDSRPKNSIFTFAALNYYISDASNSIALLENDPDAYIQKVLRWFGFDLDDTEALMKTPVIKMRPLNSFKHFWKKRNRSRSIVKAGPTSVSSSVACMKQLGEKFFVAERKIGHRELMSL